jgi:hypothetical protein|tara:strand:+ start:223 stop:480 length:258 start_codon:yes stop_codon:yes gene_type:complete
MKVKFYSAEFDIPELMIDKFIKDFDTLAGSGKREEIGILRDSIGSIFEVVAEDPEILHEPEYLSDFIQAMAMKKAMETHGIFYDA